MTELPLGEPAPATLLPRGLPFGWRGVGVVLGGMLTASFLLDPVQAQRGPTLCIVRRLTGLPCPGCGLTRSFTATAHLQIERAFTFHPFGPALFAISVLALSAIVFRAVAGRWPLSAVSVPWIKGFGGVFLAAWLAWAVWRAVHAVI